MMDRDADGDLLRQRFFRSLLYGAPIVAALSTFTTYRLILEMPLSPKLIAFAGVVGASVAALGSAAGAFCLRNRLSWRIAHSVAAAMVSVAVYATVLAALFAVMPG